MSTCPKPKLNIPVSMKVFKEKIGLPLYCIPFKRQTLENFQQKHTKNIVFFVCNTQRALKKITVAS